jgi:hypothetical protein
MSVNCWPSPLGDGTSDVNIEYETDINTGSLEDVIIMIPFPVYNSSSCLLIHRSGSIPEVREVDGNYQITAAGFEWRPSVSEVENGRLEFNVEGDDVEGFYPVEVRYKTTKPVCTIDVSPLATKLTRPGYGCQTCGCTAECAICKFRQGRVCNRHFVSCEGLRVYQLQGSHVENISIIQTTVTTLRS